MWIDYKEVENLLTAEMWKSLLEGEGLPAKILPVEGILEWSENTKFRLMVPKVESTLQMKYLGSCDV